MNNINDFKLRLKELRKKNKMTQQDLADKLGIVRTAITNYETGRTIPDSETLNLLANILNTTTDYLLAREPHMPHPYQNDPIYKIIEDDPELLDFYKEMKHRDNLKLLFKQTKDMSEKDIDQILRIIKAIENQEDGE